MSISNFDKDLKLGQKYEQEALKYFKYNDFKISEGKFKPYDIELTTDNGKRYIEVKCDRLAHKTGNLAIEYECNGQPSGLNSTKAHIWIYFIVHTKEVFIIPVKKLKELINNCKSVNGGDGYRSKMFLLPKNNLLDFSRKFRK